MASPNFSIHPSLQQFYEKRKWTTAPFQREVWEKIFHQYNGLLNAPTGSGKTYALFLGFINWYIQQPTKPKGIQLLWISPIRALTIEIAQSMQRFLDESGIDLNVSIRTGDSTTKEKQAITKGSVDILITTPESLHVLVSQKNSLALFSSVQLIVVDEWHELMGSKRGVQTELILALCKSISKSLIWGISATIGNLDTALTVLLGTDYDAPNVAVVKHTLEKPIHITSILPKTEERFPWAGHLGIRMLDQVVEVLQSGKHSLLFTNTRAQAEIWYQRILDQFPEFAGHMAIHHASLSADIRHWVEDQLHQGKLKVVVCTSSLDLGVDFTPVDTVIQIGSPKGINRCLQRAGRSGHQPGKTSTLYFVPTHALELLEVPALREAIKEQYIEEKLPLTLCYDVLVQFILTLACGDSMPLSDLLHCVRRTYAFQDLQDTEWQSIVLFCMTGGTSLQAYPQYSKLTIVDGKPKLTQRRLILQHRLSIGTIPNGRVYQVRKWKGGYLGSMEEWFISGLSIGDKFWFAGMCLELIKVEALQVIVRPSTATGVSKIPTWMGGRMPLSAQLSEMLRKSVALFRSGDIPTTERTHLAYIKTRQETVSIIPDNNTLLIEWFKDKEGTHIFVYPFEGRLVHEGLAALVAYRISLQMDISFSLAFNDYGFELLTDKELNISSFDFKALLRPEGLLEDMYASVNITEMARKKFRDIAQISGLLFMGYPGKPIKNKHLQTNAQLFFDVFMEYEPDHFLLQQAFREVLWDQLEEVRLTKTLQRIAGQRIVIQALAQPGPFCFPILVDRLRERMSTESIEDRIRKMILDYAE
ncbi:MAG: ligase-associated DNA damage response DEXH box helicase [Cytophagaceae bacterium]|jgi:ATP-dependent Lhr-like helicase|nr:ligase-associated DNA damage response DEXH box helicase [Cytophagaceae bacterium]